MRRRAGFWCGRVEFDGDDGGGDGGCAGGYVWHPKFLTGKYCSGCTETIGLLQLRDSGAIQLADLEQGVARLHSILDPARGRAARENRAGWHRWDVEGIARQETGGDQTVGLDKRFSGGAILRGNGLDGVPSPTEINTQPEGGGQFVGGTGVNEGAGVSVGNAVSKNSNEVAMLEVGNSTSPGVSLARKIRGWGT